MKEFSFPTTDLFLPLRLGRTARDTLQEFIDIDVTAGDLVRILTENQAYRDLIFRFVNKKAVKEPKAKEEEGGKKAKEEPLTPTHRLINLLGMLGTRNLVVALRIFRQSEGRFPITDSGEVDIKAGDYVKRGLEFEDLFVRNKLEYSETAYAAGVYFDFVTHLYAKHDAMRSLEEYFKRTWNRATRTALLAYFLAERLKGYTPKTALAAGLLAHAGKLHQAVWQHANNYAELEEKWDTNPKIPPLGALLLERQAFGLSQEEVGAQSLYYFDVFRGLAPSIRAFREPYLVKGVDPVHYELALLLWLADSMARVWKIPADEKDPVFEQWKYPGGGPLASVRRATLIEVMKRAMTLR